jgi:nitrite reductase/ring-hydroxylating ferredoxin subunit
VKALCEDIVLFRKPSGEVGAVYPRCVHRGADLFFGKIREEGIRCPYHAWTFDTNGKCNLMPCEPNNGGGGRERIIQPWYPVEERYGLIFVYLGPLDKKPPLPHWDVLDNLPEGFEVYADDTSIPSAGAGYMPCNWLQHHENGIDPHHVSVVHENQFPPEIAKADLTDTINKFPERIQGHGIWKNGPLMVDFKVEMPIPTIRIIPDPLMANMRPDGKADSIAWTLPKDNTDTITFTAIVKPIGFVLAEDAAIYLGKTWKEMTPEEHQREPGDFETQVGQGPITYHSEEHLFSSDKGIVAYRRMLQNAIADMEKGLDPPMTFGTESIFYESWAGVTMMENPDYVPTEADLEDEELIIPKPFDPEMPLPPPVAVLPPAPPFTAPKGEEVVEKVEESKSYVGIDGPWDLILKSPMGNENVRLTITQSGSKVTGTMGGSDGEKEIFNGSIEGNNLKWEVKVSKPISVTLKFNMLIDGDTIAGKFKPGIFPSSIATGRRP